MMQSRIEAYQNGATLAEVAQREGVTRQAIAEYLEYHGIPRRPRGYYGRPARDKETPCTWCGVVFVADRAPVPGQRRFCSVRHYIDWKQHTTPNKSRQCYEIRKRWGKGMTWREIADRVGLSSAIVAVVSAKRYAQTKGERGRWPWPVHGLLTM